MRDRPIDAPVPALIHAAALVQRDEALAEVKRLRGCLKAALAASDDAYRRWNADESVMRVGIAMLDVDSALKDALRVPAVTHLEGSE